MNEKQKKRYDKIFCEGFYLLNKTNNNKNLSFDVSGSKQDVYTVDINMEKNKIFCSCQDMKSWAAKQHVVCKHCCFVLFRVLKCFSNTNSSIFITNTINKTDYFNTLTFDQNEINFIISQFDKINFQNNDYVNLQLKNKYDNIISQPDQTIIFHGLNNTKQITGDELCPICYMNIEENEKEKLVICPICNTYLHIDCMEIYLNTSKICKCVYCQNDIWKKYKRSNLQNISTSVSKYINLNDI